MQMGGHPVLILDSLVTQVRNCRPIFYHIASQLATDFEDAAGAASLAQ
jgi:hypothetical protein